MLAVAALGVRHCDRKKVMRYQGALEAVAPSYSPVTKKKEHCISSRAVMEIGEQLVLKICVLYSAS